MTPVLLLIVNPAGRPVAEYVIGLELVLVAVTLTLLTTSPFRFCCVAGTVVIANPLPAVTVHVKDALPLEIPLVAVTFTVYGLPVLALAAIVPVMAPVVELIDKPDGRPVAL
jgi:hypothetical protein